MRKLSTEKRAMILHSLVEGNSINATARMCGCSKITVLRLLADADRTDEAEDVLAKADPTPEVEQLRAAIRLRASGSENLDELRERFGAGDLGAAVSLANGLHARGEVEAALQVLLDAIRRESSPTESPARQRMLDLFKVLGASDPLVRKYRSELARALF